MKFCFWLAFAISALSAATCPAQTHLVTRGTEQLLKGDTLFTMQNQVDYRVIGVSSDKAILIETGSLGPVAFPNAKRFRVIPGGTFAPDLTVRLTSSSAVFVDDPGVPKVERPNGYYYGPNYQYPRPAFCGARFNALLISPKDLVHVFVAFQWYEDGKPTGTDIQTIGNVSANNPVNIACEIPLEASQKSGTYTFHVYSGYYEVKHLDTKQTQDDKTETKQRTDAW